MINIRIPTIISVLVLLGAIIVGIFIFNCNCGLDNNQKIQNLIALVALSVAIISVVFVINSYLLTNAAFVLSQQPSLLIQVNSGKENNVPYTQIHYRNVTNNTFFDLTFNISVYANNKVIDISDIFRSKMNMPGQDSRQRTFKTAEILSAKGFDILNIDPSKTSVRLTIEYQYIFMNNATNILAQEYKWNHQLSQWEIY
ncbi:hypothetical protein KKG41_05695 [Patescibacteria group bacterium]|nr:hypothetical protein [Patescibacteria group bacterium]MBU1890356.1 hypothetical protein [Patescibacteria group bacterium]